MVLDNLAELIFKNRYALNDDETWQGLSERVAQGASQVEGDYKKWMDLFASDVYDMRFLPGGRILRNVGRPRGSLFNCYVEPLEDSMRQIGQFQMNCGILWSEGGGVGCNASFLRPEDAPIIQKGGESSGPISFLKWANAGANTIKVGGSRRAAALAMMNVSHPDIIKFINAKLVEGELNCFNISVAVTEEFLQAVEANDNWDLKWKTKVWNTVPARDIWDLILKNMVQCAEPGLINWDNLRSNNSYYFDPIIATNPCGEVPLGAHGVCCLGSLVLPNFITGTKNTNWQLMEKTVHNAVRFLDNIIQINKYALEEVKRKAFDGRRIGLGVMGLAEYLFSKGLRYGSPEAIRAINTLMENIRNYAYEASCKLAEEKEPFPKFDVKEYGKAHFFKTLPASIRMKIKKHGMRNVSVMAVAPTGCQDKNTIIITNKGILTLEEIGDINGEEWQNIDMKVSQENHLEERDATKFYINGKAKTKKIYLKSGNTLESTYNHQYRVLEDGNYIWKRADELNIGDDIVSVLHTYNKNSNPDLHTVDITHGNQNNINPIFSMNEKLAKFLGIYFGDGSNHEKGIRINCNANNEEEYLYVAKLGKEIFGVEPTFSDNKRNCISVYFNSQLILKFLELNGLLKQKSNNITIPKTIRISSRSCIDAFIKGLIFADGSKSGNNVYLDTASEKLAKELLVIIRALGNDVRIQEHTSGLGSEMFRVWIKKGIYKFRPLHEQNKKRQLESLDLDTCIVDEVIKIEESENYTYDIEVPSTVTYIANSVVSHNTISLLPGVSSSIEPLFGKAYLRSDQISKRVYMHHLYKKIIEKNEEIPDWYVDSFDLKPEDHFETQVAVQKYIDGAVSKTINCPKGFKSEQLSDLLLEYIRDLKGVTAYVDGSREGQILTPLTKEQAIEWMSTGEVITEQEEQKCSTGSCEI